MPQLREVAGGIELGEKNLARRACGGRHKVAHLGYEHALGLREAGVVEA